MANGNEKIDRRGFVGDGIRVMGAIGLTGLAGALAARTGDNENLVWQLDPDECMGCTNCQTYCVLDVSAVKAVQCFPLCGYCDVCPGYFDTNERTTAAENQLCPTGALVREFKMEQSGNQRRFEYRIDDESLCIGCGKCVKGCAEMNGSLYLQVRHDRCLNCNECAIAVACPTEAFRRVPADLAVLLQGLARTASQSRRQKVSEKLAKTASMEKAKELEQREENLREALRKDQGAREYLQRKAQRG